jgi:hypothetical protein
MESGTFVESRSGRWGTWLAIGALAVLVVLPFALAFAADPAASKLEIVSLSNRPDKVSSACRVPG